MRSEPDTVGTRLGPSLMRESASESAASRRAYPAVQGDEPRAGSSPTPPYRCHCPDWYEGENCDHE